MKKYFLSIILPYLICQEVEEIEQIHGHEEESFFFSEHIPSPDE